MSLQERCGERPEPALWGLRGVFHFDAVQILRHEPAEDRTIEVARAGYQEGSAWALQDLFGRRYGIGFTRWMSPRDGLPPSISAVSPSRRREFLASEIYRDHLQAQGFCDGMSVELFHSGSYVGLAHFSSYAAAVFSDPVRRRAASIAGLLAALLTDQHAAAPDVRGSKVVDGPGRASAVLGGLINESETCDFFRDTTDFTLLRREAGESELSHVHGMGEAWWSRDGALHRYLDDFESDERESVRHLWLCGGAVYALVLRRLSGTGGVELRTARCAPDRYWSLSIQELRVASLIAAGLKDDDIAQRLSLSLRTVPSHAQAVRHKLGARNRVEVAVRIATTHTAVPVC